MVLETQRLILRPINKKDLSCIQEYAGDMENLRFLCCQPNTPVETKGFIKYCIQNAKANPRKAYNFAICLKGGGPAFGHCSLTLDEEGFTGEVGWLMDKSMWGKGYGTEVCAVLLTLAFATLKLHRVFATCDSENTGSFRIMEKNDMRREGLLLKSRNTRGQWRDGFIYGLLREEWEGRKL